VKDGGWSYVFGDLTSKMPADLIEGARLFQTPTMA
jgi:predicted metal-binding protein